MIKNWLPKLVDIQRHLYELSTKLNRRKGIYCSKDCRPKLADTVIWYKVTYKGISWDDNPVGRFSIRLPRRPARIVRPWWSSVRMRGRGTRARRQLEQLDALSFGICPAAMRACPCFERASNPSQGCLRCEALARELCRLLSEAPAQRSVGLASPRPRFLRIRRSRTPSPEHTALSVPIESTDTSEIPIQDSMPRG